MSQPMLVYGLLLAGIFISVDVQGINALLECRVCRSAVSLEDCRETQVCSNNEECYTDQILTSQLSIIYNAGCRLRAVCLAASSTSVGKRAESYHIGCSQCCNTSDRSDGSIQCNAHLCGLQLRTTYPNQCYYCGEGDLSHGSVAHAGACRKLKLCADDEFCRVTTQTTHGVSTYSFGCGQRLQCQMLTIISLENEGVKTNVDLAALVGRKRQMDVCDICCGDGLCNDAECDVVKTRLVAFAMGGRFNYTSLRII